MTRVQMLPDVQGQTELCSTDVEISDVGTAASRRRYVTRG